MRTERGKTAIARTRMSRPIAAALHDNVIKTSSTVLDYGCGRGGDIRALESLNISCLGWDPEHRPGTALALADVVNLGYVVNVIEDPTERARALQMAWALSQETLIVSARLSHEKTSEGLSPWADGWLTSKNTFQKFYSQDELRDWIEQCLGFATTAAAPGIYYVFREESARQAFLARRIESRPLPMPRVDLRELFEQHRPWLEPILRFVSGHGRVPEQDEVAWPPDVTNIFGSLQRALRAVIAGIGEEDWIRIREQRSEDLLAYLALSRLSGRPRFGELPVLLQRDVRALFGSYEKAVSSADEVLFSAGDMGIVRAACGQSPVGKLTNEALYVHVEALDRLPAVLRVYEGCARTFIGSILDTTIVKLRFDEPVVAYLSYPRFDQDPHPALASSVVVPLRTFKLAFRDYQTRPNPPVLHRKELFVLAEYPHRGKFERLTRQEERWGLYDEPERIGTKLGWEQKLAERRVQLVGHRVIRARGGLETDLEQ